MPDHDIEIVTEENHTNPDPVPPHLIAYWQSLVDTYISVNTIHGPITVFLDAVENEAKRLVIRSMDDKSYNLIWHLCNCGGCDHSWEIVFGYGPYWYLWEYQVEARYSQECLQ